MNLGELSRHVEISKLAKNYYKNVVMESNSTENVYFGVYMAGVGAASTIQAIKKELLNSTIDKKDANELIEAFIFGIEAYMEERE